MNIDGLSINYEKAATPENKLAVLLPGYLDSKDYPHLTTLAQDLRQIGYDTIRFDPTGTWESEGETSDFCITTYLGDLEEAISYATAENGKDYADITLAGHSLGGQVGLIYAGQHPEITALVCIMSPLQIVNSAFTTSTYKKWKKDGLRISKRDLPTDPDQFRLFEVPYSFAEDRVRYEVATLAKQYKNKLLVIVGEGDIVITPEDGRQIYDTANEPKVLKSIPKIGHDYRHKPEEIREVNAPIIDFLSK